jgi:F0F1-type ATP synthase epsilon subunit
VNQGSQADIVVQAATTSGKNDEEEAAETAESIQHRLDTEPLNAAQKKKLKAKLKKLQVRARCRASCCF